MSRAAAAKNTVVYGEGYTVAQLRKIASEQGIKGYGSMTKAQLLAALNEAVNTDGDYGRNQEVDADITS